MGAPGAGKSKFAKKLATEMRRGGRKVKILDKYVPDLEKKTGYSYGNNGATHAQNYQIILHRWTLEQEAAKDCDDLIVVGTLYDSVCDILIHSTILENIAEAGDKGELVARAAAMHGMSLIEAMICQEIDLLLFVPYSDTIRAEQGVWNILHEERLSQILEAYYKRGIELVGKDSEKLRDAKAIIERVQIAQNDGSAVQRSSEPDAQRADQDERMSDLQSDSGGSGVGSTGVDAEPV
jgi:hypothetical protein